ncbi:winged helix DNA-binding protein [Natrialba sp. INN-245]|uniref:winged helix DNA-binding protein n=1 Tax=Natrialba sp. INN-245 TaxID=2690967 RepID=UPI0013119280|nr:winged helix DNA-binding protein [Natrialba sp. INN-245]MWV39500.1 winged helix DNA-binding protein [Natrialba sp. INN-245]
MRKSGSWMTIWDDRILEYIREEESGSPKELEESGYLRVSKSHISRRLRKLAEHDLLRHLGNGVYVITDRGEAYLDGEIDTSEDASESSLDVPNGDNNGER